MKEHPILFSTDMVRAILNGRKTQTRRPVKGNSPESKCPWKLGDRLWVRGTWGVGCRPHPLFGWVDGIEYKADALDDDELPLHVVEPPVGIDLEDFLSNGWRPSIHMPRWACRILLEIDGIRLERLQEIAEEDAKAEGVKPVYIAGETPYRAAFHALWIDMYRSREMCWEANPWVWAIRFHVLEMKT